MDAWMQNQQRDQVATTRRRPTATYKRTISAQGSGDQGPQGGPQPTELLLEVTDPTGQVADWLDDEWWLKAITRWGDRRLLVRVLPSEAALLHPVVLHYVDMLKRVVPGWRVVGHGYCGEVSGDSAIEALATSAFDEVHLVEGARPQTAAQQLPVHNLRIEHLFKRVRQIQQSLGAVRPILVRATSLPQVPAEVAQGELQPADAARQTVG